VGRNRLLTRARGRYARDGPVRLRAPLERAIVCPSIQHPVSYVVLPHQESLCDLATTGRPGLRSDGGRPGKGEDGSENQRHGEEDYVGSQHVALVYPGSRPLTNGPAYRARTGR